MSMNDPLVAEQVAEMLVRSQAAKQKGALATAKKLEADMQRFIQNEQFEGNVPDPDGLMREVTNNIVNKYPQHLPALLGVDVEGLQ